VLENLGYRQLTVWWRLRGVVSFIRGKKSWGKMTRKGFKPASGVDTSTVEIYPVASQRIESHLSYSK
jgi:hypothetical protein